MAGAPATSVERLVFFSDAVVAIAMTLLVLPLTEIEPEASHNVLQLLGEHQPELIAFGVSFAVTANFWRAHHRIFRSVERQDDALVTLNILWLAAIVVLPFPSAMLEQDLVRGVSTLYIANLIVCSVLTMLLSHYLGRHPELVSSSRASERPHTVMDGWFLVGPMVVALVLSLFDDSWGLLALLLLIPAQMIGPRVQSRGRQAEAPVNRG